MRSSSSSSLCSSTMGILQHHYRHRHHHHHYQQHQHRLFSAVLKVLSVILCLLVSSTSASSSSSFYHASLPARSLFSSTRHQLGRGLAMGLTSQEKIKSSRRDNNNGESVMMNRRRVLIRMGVGSSPPTCRSRCGRCSPCKAVHVAIQPGRSVILEYYPEAWRCKCGNKLFMP